MLETIDLFYFLCTLFYIWTAFYVIGYCLYNVKEVTIKYGFIMYPFLFFLLTFLSPIIFLLILESTEASIKNSLEGYKTFSQLINFKEKSIIFLYFLPVLSLLLLWLI